MLAAGRSERFGRPKHEASIAGRTMLQCVLDAMGKARVEPLVVVVADEPPPIIGVRVVVNPRAAEGIGTSIAAGVRALPDDIRAVVLAVGDQPGITAGLVSQLIEAWRDGRGEIVRPVWRGQPRHPVVFDQVHLQALRDLAADEGGRTIIARHPAALYVVEVADERLVADVDTPDDLSCHVG